MKRNFTSSHFFVCLFQAQVKGFDGIWGNPCIWELSVFSGSS